jgi:exodeoxyribonuclease VII large subunit
MDELSRREFAVQSHRLELAAARLTGVENRLKVLSPLAVLQRGYALVMKDDQVVVSRNQVAADEVLRIRLRDGEFDARVTGEE